MLITLRDWIAEQKPKSLHTCDHLLTVQDGLLYTIGKSGPLKKNNNFLPNLGEKNSTILS